VARALELILLLLLLLIQKKAIRCASPVAKQSTAKKLAFELHDASSRDDFSDVCTTTDKNKQSSRLNI